MNIPRVTIIILNFNGIDDTRIALDSLLKTKYSNFKVIVVDNGSDVNEAKLLRKEFKSKKIDFLRFNKNYGFTGGNNLAVKKTSSKYVVLLNNDTKVDPNWLKPLVKIMEHDKQVAVVQPKILFMKNPKYFDYAGACGGYIDRYGYPFTRGRIFNILEKDRGQYNKSVDIFWASGAAFMFRRRLIGKRENLFDDKFFNYMEEIDFCWQVLKKGYKIKSIPESIVYHKVAATSGRYPNRKRYFEHRNNLLLLSKHLTSTELKKILIQRILLELITYYYYLSGLHFKTAAYLLKAHIDSFKYFKNRKVLPGTNFQRLPIFEGSIVVQHFLKKRKYYRQLK